MQRLAVGLGARAAEMRVCKVKTGTVECTCTFHCTLMPTPISATQARKDFFKILKNVGSVGRVYSVRLTDYPDVILMSQDEYEGWQETFDILRDPKLLRSMKAGVKDMKAGRVLTLAEVERSLKR